MELEKIDKLKLVMWDLDGTIVDSRRQHHEASKEVLKQHGFELPKDHLKTVFGQTANEIFGGIFGDSVSDIKLKEIIDERDSKYRELIKVEAKFLPGVENWIKDLYEMGITQVVASSTAYENITTILETLKAQDYFSEIYSGANLPSKPDPAVFLIALESQGTDKENCLVFEDSPHGIHAAKSIGLKCIASAITFPHNKLTEADLVVETFEQLQWKDIHNLFA